MSDSEKKKQDLESCSTQPQRIANKNFKAKIDITELKYNPKHDSLTKETSDSFRDSVRSIDKEGHRIWIYPQKPKGKFYNLRTYVSWLLLAILFINPFIKVNGNPLFLFNILERKFVLFGVAFWPQDFYIFALSLLTIAIGVVMFTAIFGRVWCGWACPQTIFMEMVFRKIEYLIEGNSNKQRALERQEWDGEKIFKKLFKWSIFYALSFVIGNLLLSYIIGIDQLFKIISDPIGMHVGGLTTMIIFSFVFFGVFTWFREQACTYVCPYGRLQSVLLDANTIVVAYDNKRGDPRAKFRKKDRDPNAGDCIECNKCIQVCPTGIDIKDGTQLECINCTACMDACDAVMEQIGKPKGLIRYTSLNNIQEGKKFKWTPRLYFYSTILTILTVLVFSLLLLRKDIDATILRAKGDICTVLPNGNIANMYTFKIINKSSKDMELTLKSTRYNAKFTYIGADKLIAPANQIITGTFLMEIPAEKLMLEKNNIEIDVYSGDKKVNSKSSIFIVPEKTKKEIK